MSKKVTGNAEDLRSEESSTQIYKLPISLKTFVLLGVIKIRIQIVGEAMDLNKKVYMKKSNKQKMESTVS